VAGRVRDTERDSDLLLRGRQNRVISTISPCSTALVLAGISI
jgi:hypothetical protein